MKRKWDVSSKEIRRKCVDEVITRVGEAGGPEIGIIAAEDIIDLVTQNLGPDIYNHALKDAKKLITGKMTDLEAELDLLENQN